MTPQRHPLTFQITKFRHPITFHLIQRDEGIVVFKNNNFFISLYHGSSRDVWHHDNDTPMMMSPTKNKNKQVQSLGWYLDFPFSSILVEPVSNNEIKSSLLHEPSISLPSYVVGSNLQMTTLLGTSSVHSFSYDRSLAQHAKHDFSWLTCFPKGVPRSISRDWDSIRVHLFLSDQQFLVQYEDQRMRQNQHHQSKEHIRSGYTVYITQNRPLTKRWRTC